MLEPAGIMVLILDGNLENVAQAGRKIGLFGKKGNPICDCSQSNQMPYNSSNSRNCHKSSPNTELPSNIGTMAGTVDEHTVSKARVVRAGVKRFEFLAKPHAGTQRSFSSRFPSSHEI